MSKDDSHPIRNKIIASVAAGIILSALGYVAYAAPEVFRWIGRGVISIWNYLASSSNIPNWLLWLLIFFSAATVIRVIRGLSKREQTNEPTFRMYKQDSFEGVTWRWSYGYDGRLVNVTPYCPVCDALLVYVKQPTYLSDTQVSFYCESCKKGRTQIQGGDQYYAMSMIERLIDRKIRNGEWKRVIERDGSNWRKHVDGRNYSDNERNKLTWAVENNWCKHPRRGIQKRFGRSKS